MTEAHCTLVASELGIAEKQVRAVEALLAEGATIPFIARYRKERTGSLEIMVGFVLPEKDCTHPTSLAGMEKRARSGTTSGLLRQALRK